MQSNICQRLFTMHWNRRHTPVVIDECVVLFICIIFHHRFSSMSISSFRFFFLLRAEFLSTHTHTHGTNIHCRNKRVSFFPCSFKMNAYMSHTFRCIFRFFLFHSCILSCRSHCKKKNRAIKNKQTVSVRTLCTICAFQPATKYIQLNRVCNKMNKFK